MGHTRGPFRILHRSDRSIDRTHDGKIIIIDDRLFFIASVHADADEHEAVEQEEQLANALLFAAAPDLLAALEGTMKVLRNLRDHCQPEWDAIITAELLNAWDANKAAIKKAKEGL